MTAMLEQPTRRAPELRRRRWPVALAAALVLLGLATAGVVVWFTPVLGLRSVAVKGATGAVAEQVGAAVAVPDGTPLVRIDLAEVATRVEAVPAVASATAARTWPNGITVTVKLRTPVARTSANGAVWLLDATGLPYQRVQSGVSVPAGLPVLELATPGPSDPATTAALAVAAALPASLKAQVKTIRAPSEFAVALELTDGREVFWGGADHNAEKLAVLPAVLTREGHYYDIRVPDLVVVR